MGSKNEPVAIVTGGGNGLGRAIALGLAERGCRIAVNDIDAAAAEYTVSLCCAVHADARACVSDLTAPGEPERVVEETAAVWGRVDVLVNNAGLGGVESFFHMSASLWQRTLAINLTALALATAAAGRLMRDQRSGRIINITSPAARMALPNYAAYAASKAGVDAVTRAAAVALAPYGVLVNSVAPGMMDTELQRQTEIAMAAIEHTSDIEAFIAERTKRIPLGHRVEPEEVARGVVWLALDAPAYMTAERLNLSGGLDKD